MSVLARSRIDGAPGTWDTAAMPWIFLLLAGAFEVGFTTAFRFVEGWKPLPILVFLICATASLIFLYKALDDIPLGTAYAVWTGIGAAGTVLSAACALLDSDKSAEDIARRAMAIAAEICVYTNGSLTVEILVSSR